MFPNLNMKWEIQGGEGLGQKGRQDANLQRAFCRAWTLF